MTMILSIAAGGAFGSVLRYLMIMSTHNIIGANYPFGTLFVNVLGSFFMGVAVIYFVSLETMTSELKAFLTIGLLGAFTTFSAFSYDVMNLWEKGDFTMAFAYGAASVILSIGAIFLGVMLMRHIMA